MSEQRANQNGLSMSLIPSIIAYKNHQPLSCLLPIMESRYGRNWYSRHQILSLFYVAIFRAKVIELIRTTPVRRCIRCCLMSSQWEEVLVMEMVEMAGYVSWNFFLIIKP